MKDRHGNEQGLHKTGLMGETLGSEFPVPETRALIISPGIVIKVHTWEGMEERGQSILFGSEIDIVRGNPSVESSEVKNASSG